MDLLMEGITDLDAQSLVQTPILQNTSECLDDILRQVGPYRTNINIIGTYLVVEILGYGKDEISATRTN